MNKKNEEHKNKKEDITINQFVEVLQDEATVMPDEYIEKLSFISVIDINIILPLWNNISAKRKLLIMQQIEEIASLDSLLSFDSFCISTLNDSMEEIRRISLRTLWDSEDIQIIPKLINILKNDKSPGPRGEAAVVLSQFIFMGELGKVSKELYKEMEDALFSHLEDEDEEDFVRQRCLESLGYSSRNEIQEIIESKYFQNDDDWLASSLLAMGRNGDQRWNDLVLDKLEHSNSLVQIEAIKASGELAIPDADLSLFNLTQDSDKDIRLATAWALSEIGGKEARIAIENMLAFSDDDEETELVEQALENLNFMAELDDFSLLDFSDTNEEV